MPSPSDVAVVGAGLAGLSAAEALTARGRTVRLFDKGRGPGGRTSLRRAEPHAFDHGAQYFTVRDARFRERVEAARARGHVAPWEGEIAVLGAGGSSPATAGTERWVGVPGMNALARDLAAGLEVASGVRVGRIAREDSAWSLADVEGRPLGSFERVLVTAPPAQAAELVEAAPALAQRLRAIEVRPAWAVLLGLASGYDVPFDGAFCDPLPDHPVLSWVARDSSKPGRPEAESWVLHASPAWTEERLEDDPASVAEAARAELERRTGVPLPTVRHLDVHRWRYALPAEGAPAGPWTDESGTLAVAGDALAGGRVEGAWLSGLAAAERWSG